MSVDFSSQMEWELDEIRENNVNEIKDMIFCMEKYSQDWECFDSNVKDMLRHLEELSKYCDERLERETQK